MDKKIDYIKLRLDQDTKLKFKNLAMKKDKTMSELLLEFIDNAISEEEIIESNRNIVSFNPLQEKIEMKRPVGRPKNKEPKKSYTVSMTTRENREIKIKAMEQGQTVSEYIIEKCLKDI